MLRREGHLLTTTYWRSDKAAGWAEWVEHRHPAQGEEPDSRSNQSQGVAVAILGIALTAAGLDQENKHGSSWFRTAGGGSH